MSVNPRSISGNEGGENDCLGEWEMGEIVSLRLNGQTLCEAKDGVPELIRK